MLARTGFVVVPVPVNVSGFRLVLARGWHERTKRGRVEHLPVRGRSTLAIELDDAETRVIRRATTTPVRNIKANRPRTVPSGS